MIDLLHHGRGCSQVVELFIDNESGITTELCAEISREVSRLLDLHISRSYRLTVSSPGIDRPLKFPWQFAKHVGRELIIKRKGNPEETAGKLLSVSDSALTVSSKAHADGFQIEFDSIESARIKVPW